MPITHPIQKTKNVLHGLFPMIGAARFGMAGTRMVVIGITGTDGKSSSVLLTAAMLRAAGHRVAHVSSISFHDGLREYPNETKMTTPGHMRLHAFLHAARQNGCTHAVVEITSQGILQHRHRGIGFSLIGITNITPEHIEAHGDFARYQHAKLSLLDSFIKDNKGLVIERETYAQVKDLLPRNIAVSIAASEDESQSRITVREEHLQGSVLDVSRDNEVVQIRTRLGGPFAPRNIAFAVRIASAYGVPLSAIRAAVESFACIPGRFEIMSRKPLVIVDYAHTLNALQILLPYVRSHTQGTLVHVFGAAGGGRDRYKRPLLARMSERYADVSILTEENSFDEPVGDIINDIRAGFSASHPVHTHPRREDAVRCGLRLLTSPRDTLLLTAKGSETVIAGAHGRKRPYNERAYISCLLGTSSSV